VQNSLPLRASPRRAVWLALLLAGLFVDAPNARANAAFDLGGRWERWIGGRQYDTVDVPSSYRPVGVATLQRTFLSPKVSPRERAFLVFEGVAYTAKVSLNGVSVGEMGPWAPFEFEVTGELRSGQNELAVEISDWQTPLGPSAAWESYGGLIRPVSLDVRPEHFVANARLRYQLAPRFEKAQCTVETWVNSPAAGEGTLSIRLLREGLTILELTQKEAFDGGVHAIESTFEVPQPLPWSPASPQLYQLEVRLETAAGASIFRDDVGFRRVEIQGDQFLLNGERLVLRGVNRHDLWHQQGYTMSDAQIEKDFELIKGMGANFVRLVHYPHGRQAVRTANRLGLFVTEESGLVWMDSRELSAEALNTGLDNIERIARRDWNAPSLFALLLCNESAPALDLLREFQRRIRPLVSNVFLTTARLDTPEKTLDASKRLFDEAGLDFYTYHPYDYSWSVYRRAAEAFPGKPLVFTEWGGSVVGQSDLLRAAAAKEIGELIDENKLAGHAFWSWADLPEFSRGGGEMSEGILISGVVSEDRVMKPNVYTGLADLFRDYPSTKPQRDRKPVLLLPEAVPGAPKLHYHSILLQTVITTADQEKAYAELERQTKQFFDAHDFTRTHWKAEGERVELWQSDSLRIQGIPFIPGQRNGRTEPLVLNKTRPKVTIPVGLTARRLHLLGNVTMPDGYPIVGRQNEEVGRYVIVYEDGERQVAPLRLGLEVTRSNLIAFASRINPVAALAERALIYEKHAFREIHQAWLLSLATKAKPITSLEMAFDGLAPAAGLATKDMHHRIEPVPAATEQSLLLFAVTAETP
jgi:hypothetical protein